MKHPSIQNNQPNTSYRQSEYLEILRDPTAGGRLGGGGVSPKVGPLTVSGDSLTERVREWLAWKDDGKDCRLLRGFNVGFIKR